MIYADFECYLKKYHKKIGEKVEIYQKHEPSGFCFIVKSFDDSKYEKAVRYTKRKKGEDISLIFVNELEKVVREIHKKFPEAKMVFTEEDEKDFENAKRCYVCKNLFYNYEKGQKYRDHCYFSGKYRGAACRYCNLKMKKPDFIPVFFHNLEGYDSHLFVKSLGKTNERIKFIPKTEEKYISFSKIINVGESDTMEIRFLDSKKFLNLSLESLAKNLEPHQFKNVNKVVSGKKRELMMKKGVFPYDWFDSIEKLEMSLPHRKEFYSRLNDKNISDEEYEHAKNVWNEFEMKSMKNYHDLYMINDVLILADVFENFRNLAMKIYGIDPAWCYTSPGLSWESLLKTANQDLELLKDPDMILFFEKGIRGGISMISKRHAKANNPYMKEYDPTKPTKYILYLDANNLYGWAMTQKLPVGDFEWMKEKEFSNWKKIPCSLEVELKYPQELHDLHNEYPLAPEKMKINDVEKLVPNLHDKKKYICHHRILKLYEKLGIKITKIHRGIKFTEKKWMKKYITLNTNMRINAKTKFEKNFYKLMNNSVFGKTIGNIRKRVNIDFVTSKKKAEKLFAKPNYDKTTIFSQDLIAVHMKKTEFIFDKPIYTGMCILDLSKLLMFDFHYNYIKKKFGDDAKLLFTDTDSLEYEIETENVYKDISSDVQKYFDTSNYSPDHPSGIATQKNHMVIGKFKDEYGGKQIKEWVGLRLKIYSNLMDDDTTIKKDKGIKKVVIKNNLTHEEYRECLFNNTIVEKEMNIIIHKNHDLYSETIKKVALSANDDKRVILENKIDTLALGHYKTKQK